MRSRQVFTLFIGEMSQRGEDCSNDTDQPEGTGDAVHAWGQASREAKDQG